MSGNAQVELIILMIGLVQLKLSSLTSQAVWEPLMSGIQTAYGEKNFNNNEMIDQRK